MNDQPQVITSLSNPRIKGLVKLRKHRERDRRGLSLIEEAMVIGRALTAGYPLHEVFFCPEQLTPAASDLLHTLQKGAGPWGDPELVEVSGQVMAKISYREKPEGLLAVACQRRLDLSELVLPDKPLLLVLENVEKPGNLGAVLRSAEGAGADAILICGAGTDLFNPNVMRASRGAFCTVPVIETGAREILAFLAARNIDTVATSPAADRKWTEVDLTGPVAVFLGAEHAGLSGDILSAARQTVSIPMHGAGDSLNLAASAAILLYEAVRQRSGPGQGRTP